MKPIEMLICSGCGEYAGSHIDAVIGGLQNALSEAIARAERAEAAASKAVDVVMDRHRINMTAKGRNPSDYISDWSVTADTIKKILEEK